MYCFIVDLNHSLELNEQSLHIQATCISYRILLVVLHQFMQSQFCYQTVFCAPIIQSTANDSKQEAMTTHYMHTMMERLKVTIRRDLKDLKQ